MHLVVCQICTLDFNHGVEFKPLPGHIFCRDHSFPTTDSSRAVVRYWQKYVHLVVVKGLGGLSLLRSSMSRLTDHCPCSTRLLVLTGL